MAIFLRGAIFYEYFRNLIIPFRNKNGLIVVKLIKKRVIYMRNIRKHELSRLSNLYIRGLLNPSLGNYFQLNCRLRRERTKSVRSNFFFFFCSSGTGIPSLEGGLIVWKLEPPRKEWLECRHSTFHGHLIIKSD